MDRSIGTPHFKSVLFFKSLIALLVVLASHVASAAITYKQSNWNAPDTPKTSVTVTYTAVQTAGDLNVVVVGWNDSTASVASVTDTKGNSYVRAVGPTLSSGFATLSIYYAKNIAAASANGNTVTVTLNTSVNYPDIRIAEYAGLDLNAPLDVSVGASGSGTALNSGSVTTTTANDLLVGGNILEHTTSAAGSGYTRRIQTNDQNILEDKIVTATGSYNATATQDSTGKWVMQMAAFKAAGSGGGDTIAPSTPTNLAATPISSTQINISWTASTDNVGVTGYKVESCSGASCTNFAQIGTPTSTSYTNTGLTASTTYRYRVRATDAAGNLSAYSSIVNATTSAAPDTTPPTAPTNLAATPASSTQINVSWTASTDNVGVTGYEVDRCTGSTCTTFVQIATPTTTTFNDTELTASTTYRYRVRARDAVPNWSSYSSSVNATTPAPPDTTPPTTPSGLSATSTSSTQVNVSWTPSTDNVGVTGYLLERCQGASCSTFAQIASPTITSYSDTGLAASTTYRYRVRATDAAGNLSAYSSIVNATTSAAADTTPPSAPMNLTATPASATQINLSWTASTDNVGVTGYKVERCQGASCSTFAQIATPTATSYSDTGLTASASYRYQVRATDAAGNLSVYSSIATATTQAAPSAPTALIVIASSSTEIDLGWTPSTGGAGGIAGYLIERCQGASCLNFAQIGTSSDTVTTYFDAGLTAGTSYSYRIRATDSASNLSDYSTTLTTLTLSASSCN